MRSINMNYFVLVLAVVVILTSAISGQSSSTAQSKDASEITSLDKVKVQIVNVLPDGAPLTVHCKSKDDDLGTHVIKNIKSYEFGFTTNFIGTTLFFCGASWHGGQVVFDVYKDSRDSERCKNCRWEAREDAVVGFLDDTYFEYDLSFPWKH